jgi:hypothetical protein
MWGLSAATRIYLAPGPTDLRKGFEGNGAKIRAFWDGFYVFLPGHLTRRKPYLKVSLKNKLYN